MSTFYVNKGNNEDLLVNLVCTCVLGYFFRTAAMPRCGGRHSRQTCRRPATHYTDGIGRCMFHSMQRSHYLWFAMLAGCAICFGQTSQAHMVEFYCCGKFYCYSCVMCLYDAARQSETGTAKCPTCRYGYRVISWCYIML
jgi:hypothetical protein